MPGSGQTRLATVFAMDQSYYYYQNVSDPADDQANRILLGALDRSGQNGFTGYTVFGNATWEWA